RARTRTRAKPPPSVGGFALSFFTNGLLFPTQARCASEGSGVGESGGRKAESGKLRAGADGNPRAHTNSTRQQKPHKPDAQAREALLVTLPSLALRACISPPSALRPPPSALRPPPSANPL